MKRLYHFKFLIYCGLCLVLCFGLMSGLNRVSAQQQKKSTENMTITNQEKTLIVYPVPVTTTVHIRISPALRPQVSKLEIINIIGRKIAEQSIIDPSTTDISFSNLDQYPSGIYMILARNKYGKIVKSAKMIIDK